MNRKINLTNFYFRNESPENRLPSASELFKEKAGNQRGDVFNNPFLEAERVKMNKLQRHVKMVNSNSPHIMEKNGRKICWNNRKGRCRFGSKCKYAHDSDVIIEPSDKTTTDSKDNIAKAQVFELINTISDYFLIKIYFFYYRREQLKLLVFKNVHFHMTLIVNGQRIK